MLVGGKIYHPGEIELPDYTQPHDYWIVGYGRSGTKWLRRMLFDTLGVFDRENMAPAPEVHKGKVGMLHWHLGNLPSPTPALYLHRDPRDVIVSMSHYWLELGGIDGVLNHNPDPAPPPLEAIHRMHQYWMSSSNEIRVRIAYRDLIANTEEMLRKIYAGLGMYVPPDGVLKGIVEFHSFDNFMSKLKEADRFRITKFMGPREGAWKDHLTRSQAKRIHDKLGFWLQRLQYEYDPSWWEGQPETIPATAN